MIVFEQTWTIHAFIAGKAFPMTTKQAYAKLNLHQEFIPAGASNRPGRALKIEFITIHNTDNSAPGANAKAHARYMNGDDARRRNVSWHYTVDDKETYKHLPLAEQGFHAGTSLGNQVSVGIEICQHQGIDQDAANDRAALLVALLMRTYDIPIEHVVPHKHWSGKQCPRLLLAHWDEFIAKIIVLRDSLEA